MRMPRRIQRRREKGFRLADLSDNYVCCHRPGRLGNPYPWQSDWAAWGVVAMGLKNTAHDRKRVAAMSYRWRINGQRLQCISAFAIVAANMCLPADVQTWPFPSQAEIRAKLGGRDLVCWCRQDDWCHADVLLALANPDVDFTGQPGPMLALMMKDRKMDPGLRRGDGGWA